MCDMGAVNNVVSVRGNVKRGPGEPALVPQWCAVNVLVGPNAFRRGRREPRGRAGGASEEAERRESPSDLPQINPL